MRDSLINIYGLLVMIGISSGAGDILLYKWAKSRNPVWLMLSYTVWLISLTLLGFFLRAEHFSFGAAILLATIIHLVVSLCWGYFFTDSRIHSLELAGLILAIIAVILMELGRTQSSGGDQ